MSKKTKKILRRADDVADEVNHMLSMHMEAVSFGLRTDPAAISGQLEFSPSDRQVNMVWGVPIHPRSGMLVPADATVRLDSYFQNVQTCLEPRLPAGSVLRLRLEGGRP